MKFCKDCKHYLELGIYEWCKHPSNGKNPVNGHPVLKDCDFSRTFLIGHCGQYAWKFEPKPEVL